MRALAVAVAVAVAIVLVSASSAAAGDGEAAVARIAGADRFTTAAALALDGFESASDAVLARADDPADALAGSYVAGAHISPVLLTARDAVPAVTLDTLHELGVHKVRVLGGPAAVDDAVVRELEGEGFTVVRLGGADRFETAAAVARDPGAANVGVRGERGAAALLANGTSPADALAAGPLAFGQQWPLLLTGPDGLPSSTRQALDDLSIRHVVVVGGTSAVSEAVVAELESSGRTIERVAGVDRAVTATALADLLVAIGTSVTRVEVASAVGFADALALGPHAAPDAPVLLCVHHDDCGDTTLAWIRMRADAVDDVVVAGGTGVVGEPAVEGLRAAAG